jgi:hypothetical protein
VITDADGFLLGRRTYDIFAGYWPKVTDPNHPIATALNSRPKYVVSRSLDRVTWNNSSLIQGDVVAELRRLRQQPGRTVHTGVGGGSRTEPRCARRSRGRHDGGRSPALARARGAPALTTHGGPATSLPSPGGGVRWRT